MDVIDWPRYINNVCPLLSISRFEYLKCHIIFQGVYFIVQIATNFNSAMFVHFAKPQNINQGIILMRCQPDKRYTFPCLNQPQNHLDVRL